MRATARHVVFADIARFYHSIYTHSIPWAIDGKAIAKMRRNAKGRRYLGNELDQLVRDCQDGQTVGIPVGPDSSLVLAELVASAVDSALGKAIRGLKGMRFIDDFEIPCRTRREADALLERLDIALARFELALNPLKTSIADLPVPLDQPWKTPIRTATVRDTAKEQATDLIAFFDIAYSLAKEFPEKSVLAYAIGRLANVDICPENAALFQRLSIQCVLAEPGTAPAVLERLAANHVKGLAVDATELTDLLTAQIVEHAPLNHSNEVAWALWGALIFDLRISKQAVKAISGMTDSVVALTALHAEQRGLLQTSIDTRLWQSYLTTENLYGEQWLLCYEASIKGWLKSPGGTDHVGADANFQWLREIGVEFYDVDKASSVGPAGSKVIDWLAELELAIESRRDSYGDPDEDDGDESPDVKPNESEDFSDLL